MYKHEQWRYQKAKQKWNRLLNCVLFLENTRRQWMSECGSRNVTVAIHFVFSVSDKTNCLTHIFI